MVLGSMLGHRTWECADELLLFQSPKGDVTVVVLSDYFHTGLNAK